MPQASRRHFSGAISRLAMQPDNIASFHFTAAHAACRSRQGFFREVSLQERAMEGWHIIDGDIAAIETYTSTTFYEAGRRFSLSHVAVSLRCWPQGLACAGRCTPTAWAPLDMPLPPPGARRVMAAGSRRESPSLGIRVQAYAIGSASCWPSLHESTHLEYHLGKATRRQARKGHFSPIAAAFVFAYFMVATSR